LQEKAAHDSATTLVTGEAAPPTGTAGAGSDTVSSVPNCPRSLRPAQNTCASVAWRAHVKDVPTDTARQGKRLAGVVEGVGVKEGEGVNVGVPDLETVRLGVALREGVPAGVPVADGVRVALGVTEPVGVLVYVEDSDEPPDAVCVPVPLLLGDLEGLRLLVRVPVHVPLLERVEEGVKLLEAVLDSVPLMDGVPEQDIVPDGVPVGDAPPERVAVGDAVEDGVPEIVSLRLWVPVCEEVPLLVGDLELEPPEGLLDGVPNCEEPPERLLDGVPLIEGVPLRLAVRVPEKVLELVPLIEGVPLPLTLPEGVTDCEEPPEGLVDWVVLRVPDGVPDGVRDAEEPPEGLFDGVPLIEGVLLRLPVRVPDKVPDLVPDLVPLGLIEGVPDCEEPPEAVVEDVPLPVALLDGLLLPVAEPVLESVRDLELDRVLVLDGEGVDENDAPAEGVAEHDASMARPREAQHAKVVHSTGASDARGQKLPTGQGAAAAVLLAQ
jgi:hypothetical protein